MQNKARKDLIMIDKDSTMFGVKVFNTKTNQKGVLIYTWKNRFATNGGKYIDIPYACCVDINGKKYDTEMDNITPLED